jgi:hypothetical protein
MFFQHIILKDNKFIGLNPFNPCHLWSIKRCVQTVVSRGEQLPQKLDFYRANVPCPDGSGNPLARVAIFGQDGKSDQSRRFGTPLRPSPKSHARRRL